MYLISGGIRFINIKNELDDKLIFREPSSSSETVRPYFLINGSESIENVRKICDKVDEDLEKIDQYVVVEYENTQIMVNIEMLPSWDGKLTRT